MKAFREKPGPKGRTGLEKQHGGQCLETEHTAEVDAAAPARSAYYAERRAKSVRVGEAPAGMIQDIIEAGIKLKLRSLLDLESLRHGDVPGEGIPVAEENDLPKIPWSGIREDILRIGPAIGTMKQWANREPLQIRYVRPAQAGQIRVEQFLELIHRDTRSEPNTITNGVVGFDGLESTAGALDRLPGIEDKDRTQVPIADHSIEIA